MRPRTSEPRRGFAKVTGAPPTPILHEATTAQEILGDFTGERRDYVVTGHGTGGTGTGIGRVLRKQRPGTQIVLCEPANAALVTAGQAQPRTADGSHAAGHLGWTPYPIQGAGRWNSFPPSLQKASTGTFMAI